MNTKRIVKNNGIAKNDKAAHCCLTKQLSTAKITELTMSIGHPHSMERPCGKWNVQQFLFV